MSVAPKVLIISHVNPFNPKAGNELRIHNMIRWLQGAGFEVSLLLNEACLEEAFCPGETGGVTVYLAGSLVAGNAAARGMLPLGTVVRRSLERIKMGLLDRGARLLKNAALDFKARSHMIRHVLCPDSLIAATAITCRELQPDVVIGEYIFSAPCLDVVPPGTVRIIDTHDMFSLKQEQVIKFGVKDILGCSRGEERRLLLKSDVVIAIQSREAELFRALVPEKEVIAVGVDSAVVPSVDNRSVVQGTVLIVASASPLNVHGLRAFYDNAWGTIRQQSPEAVLRVVGKIGPALSFADESVQVAGISQDLASEYRRAAVVINPVVAGTGLKIKSIEALCHGKALVATLNGVEGLDFSGVPPFVAADNWNAFSQAVVRLLQDEAKRLELQRRALEYAREFFATERVYAPLAECLRRRISSIPDGGLVPNRAEPGDIG